MDQGVLECLKRHYKRSLLRDALLFDETEDLDLFTFLKSVTMKVVVNSMGSNNTTDNATFLVEVTSIATTRISYTTRK